jgi:toxin ParE1/3/4
MKPVVAHPEARAEMLAAAEYYEACCPGLGHEFTNALAQALNRIGERPMAFALFECSGARKCVFMRFPYLVFFLDRESDIFVLAVAHAARKPGYWKDRLNEG